MDAFTTHTGIGVPLRRSNVDTDQIIPAEYLKRVTKSGFEDGLFAAWRADETFVLNDPTYAAGSVLVAGPDFGTGRLARARRVGADELRLPGRHLLAVRRHLPGQQQQGRTARGTVQPGRRRASSGSLLENEPGTSVTVDLESRTVTAGDLTAPFQVDDYARWRLLEGLDDISLTLRHEGDVTAYEATRPSLEARHALRYGVRHAVCEWGVHAPRATRPCDWCDWCDSQPDGQPRPQPYRMPSPVSELRCGTGMLALVEPEGAPGAA